MRNLEAQRGLSLALSLTGLGEGRRQGSRLSMLFAKQLRQMSQFSQLVTEGTLASDESTKQIVLELRSEGWEAASVLQSGSSDLSGASLETGMGWGWRSEDSQGLVG